MKVVSVVSSIFVLFIVLRIIVWGVRQFNEPDRSQSIGIRQQVPFDQQLEIFRQLHFDLNPEVDSSDIASWELDDGTAEEQPFMLVYTLLGSCIEREPFTPITNRCWSFDTEAIEDNGAYVDIIRNLERISRGALTFTDVTDHVDIDAGDAWVSFVFNGQRYRWTMRVNDDWVDETLFENIVKLTIEHNTNGRITSLYTGDQTVMLGFETEESLAEIKRATGLPIEWLE